MRFKQTADDKKKKNREKILAANNNKQTRILEKVEPKPKKRYNVDSLASQRAIKQWNMKYGDMYNADGTVKYKVKNNPLNKIVKKRPIRSSGSDAAKDRAFTPTAKPKPIRSKGSDAARDRANIKTAKPKTIRSTGSDAAKDRKNLSFTKPKEAPKGKGSTQSLMPKTYTIKSGDTLTAIAKKMGTTVAMLKKANGIKDANKIRAGKKLKIYQGQADKRSTLPPTLKNKPRTIAQAQKMGSKFFYDKNGNKKAAVTAAQLKKSGLTLSQWLKKK